jgi:hypothetical protein
MTITHIIEILLKVALNTITLTPNTDVKRITTNDLEHKSMKSKPKLDCSWIFLLILIYYPDSDTINYYA